MVMGAEVGDEGDQPGQAGKVETGSCPYLLANRNDEAQKERGAVPADQQLRNFSTTKGPLTISPPRGGASPF